MRGALLWLAMLLAVLAPSAARAQYLFVIPTRLEAAQPPDAAQPLRIAVHAADLPGLARTLGVAAPAPGTTRLELLLSPYFQMGEAPGLDTRAASFLIDFDEPAMRLASTRLLIEYGPRPGPGQLAAFVDDWIRHKSMEQGFDIASRVAESRSGDCTEHAVLLTALARASGHRARVVIGVAVTQIAGQWQGLGHAWAEIFADGRWQVADAALRGHPVHYLPVGVLAQEGPGFAIGIVALLPNWISQLDILGPAPAPAS